MSPSLLPTCVRNGIDEWQNEEEPCSTQFAPVLCYVLQQKVFVPEPEFSAIINICASS